MFCKKCNNQINLDDKFCSKCGQSVPTLNDKWWHRLLKVLYIIAYLPLPLIVLGVWESNKPYSYYSYYSNTTISYGSYGAAFWYSILTIAIYFLVLRLIKISVLYVALGYKPDWKHQFSKFF